MFIANRLRELDRATCIDHLKQTQMNVGRLAWDDGQRTTVLPVNFVLDGQQIVIRTGAGSVLEAAVAGRRAAFEVDSVSAERSPGAHAWSVLVRGQLTVVSDAAEITFLRLSRLEPAAGGLKVHFVALDMDEVTGRTL